MNKSYHIVVTQEHIDDGVAGDCGACPLALAALELPDVSTARVGYTTITINDEVMLNLPQAAQTFVLNFDLGRAVSPFSFELQETV